MEKKVKKVSPLVILTIACLAVGGAIALSVYWTSQSLTKTVSISGWITACTNFNNDDLEGVTSYAELKLLTNDNINSVIRVAADGSNAEICYASINIDCPLGSSVTAVASVYQLNNGAPDTGTTLGAIATDGSETIQVIRNGNAVWFYESDYPSGVCRVLVFLLSWDTSGLGIGDHDFTATVTLGDL